MCSIGFTVKGEAKEIAALVLAIQERRIEDAGEELARNLQQEIKHKF